MSDIDRVFARFQDARTPSTDRREVRTVPGRGTRGSRVVEVVRLRSGAPAGEPARKAKANQHAATWDEGFPARQAPQPPLAEPPPILPAAEPAVQPTVHVMPAWAPTPAASVPEEPEPRPSRAPRAPRRSRPVESRPVADPFDAADEGANCLRCGYLVEPARERRGLMTCAACG